MRNIIAAAAAATFVGTSAFAGGLLDAQESNDPTPPLVVPDNENRGSLGPVVIGGLLLLLIAGGLSDSGGGTPDQD